MKTRFYHFILSLFILSIIVIGCQDNSNKLYNTICTQIDSSSNHLLYFSDFKKSSGLEIQNETKKHIIEFTGRVASTQDVIWKNPLVYGGINGPLYVKNVNISIDSADSYFLKKGWGYDIVGKAAFEKRDEGWKLLAVNIELK